VDHYQSREVLSHQSYVDLYGRATRLVQSKQIPRKNDVPHEGRANAAGRAVNGLVGTRTMPRY
jgi:hypothetical protein